MVGDVGIPVTPNREGIPPLLPLSGRCIQHSLVLLADSGRREAHSRGGKGVLEHACPGNVDFGQTPATGTPLSTIDGLYSWASTQGDGLRILGGSKIKVRNSVFLANGGNGIRIASAGAALAANSLAGIDLGTTGAAAGNAGRNLLQAQAGSDPNVGAGICVDLATGAGAQALTAVGNQFAGIDCMTSTAAIRTSTSCAGAVDLGVTPATGTTVTVNTSTCTQ